MTWVIRSLAFLLFAALASSTRIGPDLAEPLGEFFRKVLQNVDRLKDESSFDICSGNALHHLETPLVIQNVTIASVWLDGLFNYELKSIGVNNSKVELMFEFPHLLGSADVAPESKNGTMIMMDVMNGHLTIEVELLANGSNLMMVGFKVVRLPPKDREHKMETPFSKLRQFFFEGIDNCTTIFAAEIKRLIRLNLHTTSFDSIKHGDTHLAVRRVPRQTSALNRAVDRFLREVRDELRNELSIIRIRGSFRYRFRRFQLSGSSGESSRGTARFYNGRIIGANRLRRHRNVRSYVRNGRWYARVALRISRVRIRYRARFRERNGETEYATIEGRPRTVRLLWVMSQPSATTGPTTVESVRVTIVSRPYTREPNLDELQYAWNQLRRRVESRFRQIIRSNLQTNIEAVLRDLVGTEDGAARSSGRGRQLFGN